MAEILKSKGRKIRLKNTKSTQVKYRFIHYEIVFESLYMKRSNV